MLCSQEITIVFKTAIKQVPLLFCCILVSFFFVIIQAPAVQAATRHTQTTRTGGEVTPTPTATTNPTPTPTITQPGTFTLSPATVQAGNSITITGYNWPPNQDLTIQLAGTNFQPGPSGPNGYFNTPPLPIPATTAPSTYTVIVFVTNQPTVRAQQELTVTVPAPTATPPPSASPSPTESPTATATVTPSTNNANGGGGGGLTILIFTLGTLGVLLIVIGVIMLAASSPQAQAR